MGKEEELRSKFEHLFHDSAKQLEDTKSQEKTRKALEEKQRKDADRNWPMIQQGILQEVKDINRRILGNKGKISGWKRDDQEEEWESFDEGYEYHHKKKVAYQLSLRLDEPLLGKHLSDFEFHCRMIMGFDETDKRNRHKHLRPGHNVMRLELPTNERIYLGEKPEEIIKKAKQSLLDSLSHYLG